MNKKTSLVVISIAILVGISAYVLTRKPKSNALGCQGKTGLNYLVEIKDSQIRPAATVAKLCDTMTITNRDDVMREIAFGKHDQHISYGGITGEKTLNKDQSINFIFDKTGEYEFHDHDQEYVKGTFVVVR